MKKKKETRKFEHFFVRGTKKKVIRRKRKEKSAHTHTYLLRFSLIKLVQYFHDSMWAFIRIIVEETITSFETALFLFSVSKEEINCAKENIKFISLPFLTGLLISIY